MCHLNLLFFQRIAGRIGLTRYLHALLLHERMQQCVQRLHNLGLGAEFERAMLFDLRYSLCLDVAGDDCRERTSQVCCEQVEWLVVAEIERRDILVVGAKGS